MAMEGNDRRALIILGGVALVAVLAWFIFLRGGGDEPVTVDSGQTTTAGTTAGTQPQPQPSPSPSQVVVGGLPPISGRDPFSPMPPVSPSLVPSVSASASPSASP